MQFYTCHPHTNHAPVALEFAVLCRFFVTSPVSTGCDRGPSQIETTPDCVFTVDSLSETVTTMQTVVMKRHIGLT